MTLKNISQTNLTIFKIKINSLSFGDFGDNSVGKIVLFLRQENNFVYMITSTGYSYD